MRVSTYFREVGRTVAYHPRLNNITGSTIATIFISQFLYWDGKQRDPDGWIYKTQAEIQEETGLGRREQEAARKQLKSVNLLEERLKGLPAQLEFRPNLEEFDRQWDVFLESGGSIALTKKQAECQKKIENIPLEKRGKGRSKPHGCQVVQIEQTSSTEQSKLASPSRADNIYTETTNRDYSTETYSKKKKVKRFQEETPFSFSEQDSELIQEDEQLPPGCDPNQKNKPPTDSANSEDDQGFRESQNESNQSKSKTEKPKLKYDDDGYLRVPSVGKNRLAGALTLRTMQLAILNASGVVEWKKIKGRVYMSHVDDYEWTLEEEFLKEYPIARLKAKNGCGEFDFTVEKYNHGIENWFRTWQQHLAKFPEWTDQEYSLSLMVRKDLRLNFVDD